MSARKSNRKYLYLCLLLFAGLILILRLNPLASGFNNNLGFAMLNRALSIRENDQSLQFARSAAQSFDSGLAADPRSLSAARGLGLSLGLQGENHKALFSFDRLGAQAAENVVLLGDAAENAADHDLAILWYERAVDIDPDHYSAWLKLGDVYLETGAPDKALGAYKNAWRGAPALALKPYASTLVAQSELDQAIEVLSTTLYSDLQFYERLWGWHTLGQLLEEQERWDDAYAAYQAGLEEFQQDPSLLVSLGWLLYNQENERATAIKQFQSAITADSESGAGYFAMGQLMADEKNYPEAEHWFSLALERNDSNPRWQFVRANTLRQAGEYPLAAQAYQQTIGLYPSYAPAYFELANTYRLLNSPEQALQVLDLAGERSLEPPPRYYLPMAEIYAWGGRSDKAITIYQELLEIDPNNSAALEQLKQLQND